MGITLELSYGSLRRWILGMIGIELLLVLAYVLESAIDPQIWTIRRLFDLNSDDANIAQWLSSTQLAIIGLLFALHASQRRSELEPSRWFLVLLSLGFIFLSADEALYFHETITKVATQVDWAPSFRGDHGVWVFVYGALGLLLIAACWGQLVRAARYLPLAFRSIALGMAIFIGGAVVLEVIGYQFLTKGSVLHVIEVCLEEFMEMAGGTMMLYGALLYSVDARRCVQRAENNAVSAGRAARSKKSVLNVAGFFSTWHGGKSHLPPGR